MYLRKHMHTHVRLNVCESLSWPDICDVKIHVRTFEKTERKMYTNESRSCYDFFLWKTAKMLEYIWECDTLSRSVCHIIIHTYICMHNIYKHKI